MEFKPPQKTELGIEEIGRTFNRESLLIVYGRLETLAKEYGGRYSALWKIADKYHLKIDDIMEFENIRRKTAGKQAEMLALKDPQIDSALSKYEKINREDSKAIVHNIKLALSNEFVKKEIKGINEKNGDAKGYARLNIEWKAGDALETIASIPFMILPVGCSGESKEEEPKEPGIGKAVPKPLPPTEPNMPKAGRKQVEAQAMAAVEPELAYATSTLLFTLIKLQGDKGIPTVDEKGQAQLMEGEFLYIKHGKDAQISVSNTPATHIFYNPDSGDAYYTADGSRYKKAAISDVEFTMGKDLVALDLDSISKKGNNINKALERLKTDYFGLLEKGLAAATGKSVDLSWLDATGILAGTRRATAVMTIDNKFDTIAEKGNSSNIVVGNINEKVDDLSDLIAHEFTHIIFARVQEKLEKGAVGGSIGSFGHEGVTEAVSNIVQKQAYGHFELAYGPSATLALIYLKALGTENFLKAVFRPSEASVHDEMARLFGKADFYERMRMAYFAGIKGGLSSSYSSDFNILAFSDLPYTVRFLGEYGRANPDTAATFGLFGALKNYLDGAGNYHGNIFSSYGLLQDDVGYLGGGIIRRSFDGGRVIEWHNKNAPFSLISDIYIKDRNSAMVERYKQEILLLNSLDYKNIDFGHQQIAFGILAKMALDFSAYWDGLGDSGRASGAKKKEAETFIAITEALAIRYGYSFWAGISANLNESLAGKKIGLSEKNFTLDRPSSDGSVAYMKIDKIEFGIKNTSDYLPVGQTVPWASVMDGNIRIYLKEPFSYEITKYTEGTRQYQVQVNTQGSELSLQFNDGKAEAIGLKSSFGQVR